MGLYQKINQLLLGSARMSIQEVSLPKLKVLRRQERLQPQIKLMKSS